MKQTHIPVVTGDPEDHGTWYEIDAMGMDACIHTGYNYCEMRSIEVEKLGISVEVYTKSDEPEKLQIARAKTFIRGFFVNGKEKNPKAE